MNKTMLTVFLSIFLVGTLSLAIAVTDEAGVKNDRIFESHLHELLSICDIYTGFKSSIIIEALILNKPVLLIDLYDISDEPFYKDYAIKWIAHAEDIYPNLKTYLYDENARSELKRLIPKTIEYFNYKSDGQATKRFVDLVCKMAEETLSAPVKEGIMDCKSQTTSDSAIFDYIEFTGKKILFINSMKYLDIEELSKKKADATLCFIEDRVSEEIRSDAMASHGNLGETHRRSLKTYGDSIRHLDLKTESIHTLGFEQDSFDYIVFKNSLETLYDPWTWLKDVHPYIKPEGKVLIEISNIRNMHIFSSLVNGYFTYSCDGILSIDNIRFFTPAEFSIHAVGAGYEISGIYYFMDPSLQNSPPVNPGRVYDAYQGDNFVLSKIPAESLVEMQANHFLLTLRKQAENTKFISPLHLPKPDRYYENPRMDLIEMIDKPPQAALEIGCGIGRTLQAIKNRYPECRTIGIDIDEESVKKAAGIADLALRADIEKTELSELGVEKDSFDYILYGDVLEHLANPWQILKKHKEYLKSDGKILASIPNIRFRNVLLDLLFGYWSYLPSGILDVTHLRFFTLREMKRLFRTAGLYIYDIKGNRDVKSDNLSLPREYSHFNFDIEDLRLLNVPRDEVPEFSIIQFMLKAGKEGMELIG